MRASEDSIAPRRQEVTVLIIDDDRVLAAVEDIDAVLRIGGDSGHVAMRPPGRQLLPVRDQLEREVTRADDRPGFGHWFNWRTPPCGAGAFGSMVIEPRMNGCGRQKYQYTPGSLKVKL